MNNRPKQYPAEMIERVRSLYEGGMSMTDIATEIGRSRNFVVRIRRNHDIKRGTVNEAAPVETPTPTGFRNPLAYCRDKDPGVWFPNTAADRDVAANLCRTKCPVMEGCLRYALTVREEHGVWGGCDENDRATIAGRWDGDSPLVAICETCDESFVPLVDGLRVHCTSADEAVA